MSDTEQLQVELLRTRRCAQIIGLIQSFGVMVVIMLAGVGLLAALFWAAGKLVLR